MQRRWTRPLIAFTAIALLAAGCGGDDDEDSSDTTPEESTETVEATSLSITTDDYSFTDAPAEIEGGLIELDFTNDGAVSHEVAFAEIGDTDLATFLTDFGPVIEGEGGGPIPSYSQNIAVVAMGGPGDSLSNTFLLPEGEYAMFCTLDGAAPEDGATTTTAAEGEEAEEPVGDVHYKRGMAQTITVTAGDADAALPEAEGSVVARDYTFDIDVPSGDFTMAFRNEGPNEIHHAVFFPFADGITEEAAAVALDAFLSAEGDGPPPPEFDFEAGGNTSDTGIYSAGLGEVFDQEFEAGRTYGVVCFLSDRAGGPPHAIAHDMKAVFTVE